MKEIQLKPVAIVRNSRKIPEDDNWGEVISRIELCDNIPTEAFKGISEFSHLEIIYYFDKVIDSEIVFSGNNFILKASLSNANGLIFAVNKLIPNRYR